MSAIETLVVLEDFIVISEQDKDEISSGGIILAPSAVDRSLIRKATVQKVGPGVKDAPMNPDIEVGKHVLADVRQSIEIELDSKLFRVVKQKDIVAILN